MTKEELIKKIYAEIAKLSDNASQMCEEYEGYRLACQDISDVLHEITKEIQPSLPSNLDEAAEEYSRRLDYYHYTGDDPSIAFKAGAEWMAGQGYADTQAAINEYKNWGDGFAKLELGINEDDDFFEDWQEQNEIIVQIRKKQ